jgi:hypothetical protein
VEEAGLVFFLTLPILLFWNHVMAYWSSYIYIALWQTEHCISFLQDWNEEHCIWLYWQGSQFPTA